MQEGTGEVRVRVEGEGWGRGPERGQAGTVGGLRQGWSPDPPRIKANSTGKTSSTRRSLRPLPVRTQSEAGQVRAWRRARAEHRVCLVGQRRSLDGLAHPARHVSRTSGGAGTD
eukprot:scaffold145170_cov127-Phaeocystis_antarctica.AAC.8